jgi:spermidine synthase
MNVKTLSINKYLFILIFILSGYTGLTYEILWQKQLFLILGADAKAVVAILTSFFLGIALGGKVADYLLLKYNAIKLYISLEILITAWALLHPIILEFIEYIYLAASPNSFTDTNFTLRFIFSTLSFLPATMAMGATIPAMSKILSSENENGVSLAYSSNIFGGLCGIIISNLILLPHFGISTTIHIAIIINCILISIALLLSKRITLTNDQNNKIDNPNTKFYIAFGISGFVSMASEILWFRTIGILTTNGHTTFSLILATYLIGFFIGSYVVFPLLKKYFNKENLLLMLVFLVSVSIIITLPSLKISPIILEKLVIIPSASFIVSKISIFIAEFFPIISLVLIPTIFMGAVFPAFSQFTTNLGSLYFYGNIGSMLGVLFMGFISIPFFGLINSFGLLILISIIALYCIPISKNKKYHIYSLGLIISVAFYIFNSPPIIKNNFELRKINGIYHEFKNEIPIDKILRYKEGLSGTVIVREFQNSVDNRTIFIDEQNVAATSSSAAVDSKMLAHIPLMLHPNPQNALSIGFGSGGTSWSLTRYPIKAFTVEIEPEVIKSSYLFPQYTDVLTNPNFNIILNDARDFLKTTKLNFDAISTDVTNLQYKQNPNLYTVEYFELMKSRLTKDGIACAWIPITSITNTELKILLNTFLKVFPNSTFWYMHQIYTNFGILIGTKDPLNIDYSRIKSAFNSNLIKEDLSKILITDPSEMPTFLILDNEGMKRYTTGALLHTDDFPILEYSTSNSYHVNEINLFKNLEELFELSPKELKIISNLSTLEKTEIKNSYDATLIWRQLMIDFYKHKNILTLKAHNKKIHQMIKDINKILILDPNFKPAKNLKEYLDKLLL